MTITVRLFAGLREQAGTSTVQLNLAESTTVDQALAQLQKLYPELLLHDGVAVAINQTYVPRAAALQDMDELALIPPVSGG